MLLRGDGANPCRFDDYFLTVQYTLKPEGLLEGLSSTATYLAKLAKCKYETDRVRILVI